MNPPPTLEMEYTLYHRRKPIGDHDRPIFHVRLRVAGKLVRRSCRTRIRLSAEQAARAWLNHYQRKTNS